MPRVLTRAGDQHDDSQHKLAQIGQHVSQAGQIPRLPLILVGVEVGMVELDWLTGLSICTM